VFLYSANLAYASASEFPFLAKPFSPTVLLASVSKALENQTVSSPVVEPAIAEPRSVAGPVAIAQKPRRWLQTASYLAAAAVLILSLTLGLRKVNAPSASNSDTVNLRTWRGYAGSTTAKTGRPLVLNLNLIGIPQHDSYRIELVASRGQVIWQQEIPASATGVLQAKSAALRAGVYFVRAYASPEGLLREFELDIGENP
jgi:hypothetical protein